MLDRAVLGYRLLGVAALLALLLSPATPTGAPSIATASACPGPDAFGYTCSTVSVGSTSGSVDQHINCDDCVGTIALPFLVSFYGVFFAAVNVSSNGVLEFSSSATSFDNGTLPDNRFSYAIFAYFDELHTGLQAGDGVYTALAGIPGNQRFVIEWRARLRNSPTVVANFRVRFEERSSEIYVEYVNTPDQGAGATSGIQQGTAGAFLQRSVNQAVLTSGSAVLFAPPADIAVFGLEPLNSNTVAGTVWSYHVTIFNYSPVQTANNVVISVPMPSNTTFDMVQNTVTAGVTCTTPANGATGTVVCSRPSVPPNLAVTFDVYFRVSPSVPQGTNVTFTASVTKSGNDPYPSNNSLSTFKTVTTQADVGVTKTDAPDPVVRGSVITYTLSVFNNGPSDAQAVALTDALPPGTTFESLTQVNGPTFTCSTPPVGSNGNVSCSRSSLAENNHTTLRLVVRTAVSGGPSIANSANVLSTTFDPVTANNSVIESTAAQTPTPIPQPNVSVAVTPVPASGTLQSTLTALAQNCTPNNRLQSIQFTRVANGTVTVPTTPSTTVSAPTTVALPSQPQSITISVQRVNPGQPTTVEMIVTDSCGSWPTFVGGGSTAF